MCGSHGFLTRSRDTCTRTHNILSLILSPLAQGSRAMRGWGLDARMRRNSTVGKKFSERRTMRAQAVVLVAFLAIHCNCVKVLTGIKKYIRYKTSESLRVNDCMWELARTTVAFSPHQKW